MVIGTQAKLYHCSNKCLWECKIDEDSSCKKEKVEDLILTPEKLEKKLWAASALSLTEAFTQTKNAESLVFTPNQTYFFFFRNSVGLTD